MDSETADKGERDDILTVGDINLVTECYQRKHN